MRRALRLSAKIWLVVFLVPFISGSIPSARAAETAAAAPVLSPDEKEYFSGLYRDTWHYLADHVEKMTGLPYDSSAKQPPTSITNIGFYMAATSVAYRTGLIPAEEAEKRINQALDSLDKIEKWKGIPRPWVIVRTLKPTFGEEFTYGSHLSVLIGGLLVTQASFPEISFPGIVPKIRTMLQEMELSTLYDPQSGWLKGGYNVEKKNFAVFQPWGHWYYKYFASEIRFLSYYLILRQAAPEGHWQSLLRPLQEMEGERFFVSGYEEGGIYVPYLTGLFLDERNTEMGDSQKAYARYQMKHAGKIKSPVWGWSSCMTPQGRYLAYGELRDDIVTPYASVLAAIYFPHEAAENLKRLEEMGARPSNHPRFGEVSYGFVDSVNWQTGDTGRHFLTPNQAMVFLSLANLLYDGIVWKSVQEALPSSAAMTRVEKTY